MERFLDHLASNLYVRRVLTDPDSRKHGSLKRRYWASRRVNKVHWRYTSRRLHVEINGSTVPASFVHGAWAAELWSCSG